MMAARKSNRAELLPTETPALFDEAVQKARAALREGKVVALPTETVYGLAANALDGKAVREIFRIKGRPSVNPLIVHVNSLDMARRCTSAWPEKADQLSTQFWPGPLTMVLPRSTSIPDEVTARGETVGVRWPMHPFMQAVIEACGFPLAAPSANPSNQLSPTHSSHVLATLGDSIPLIVDGGQCQVGIESTVIDLCHEPPRILRPGMVHDEALAAVIGDVVSISTEASGPPATLRSPGQLLKHYAPRAPLAMRQWSDTEDLLRQIQNGPVPAADTYVIAYHRVPLSRVLGGVSVIPHDPEAFARALYSELHRCDQAAAQQIVVEEVPEGPEWKGIRDRLKRAASKN